MRWKGREREREKESKIERMEEHRKIAIINIDMFL
jgi:hypothetical protein